MAIDEPADILSSINKSLQKSLIEKPTANSSQMAPEEVDKDHRGFKTDLEHVFILNNALLHSNIEIIQIIECM